MRVENKFIGSVVGVYGLTATGKITEKELQCVKIYNYDEGTSMDKIDNKDIIDDVEADDNMIYIEETPYLYNEELDIYVSLDYDRWFEFVKIFYVKGDCATCASNDVFVMQYCLGGEWYCSKCVQKN